MGQHIDSGGASAFPSCFKWESRESFSQLNVIKSNKRTLLADDTLDDLLMVSTMNSPLKDFNSNKAVDLWWEDKVRRPTQKQRKKYKKRGGDQPSSSTTPDSGSESESESFQLLNDWDKWMDSD